MGERRRPTESDQVLVAETCIPQYRSDNLGVQDLAGMHRQCDAAPEIVPHDAVAASLAYHSETAFLEDSLHLPRGQARESGVHPDTSTVIRLMASTWGTSSPEARRSST